MSNIKKIASILKDMTYSEIIEFSEDMKGVVVEIYDAEPAEKVAKNLIDWCDKINPPETVE